VFVTRTGSERRAGDTDFPSKGKFEPEGPNGSSEARREPRRPASRALRGWDPAALKKVRSESGGRSFNPLDALLSPEFE
jgi:hypothetical protein